MNPALLLIDLQADYLVRPGLQPPAPELVERLSRLLARWRKAGLPLIHSRTLNQPDGSNCMPHRRQEPPLCVVGTAGCEPPPALAAQAGEPVLAKAFFSAFSEPGLQARLAKARIDTLVIAGLYTHACIRASVLDAYALGYQVLVAADGIASDDPLHAELSLRWLESRACELLTEAELASRLGLPEAEPAPERQVAAGGVRFLGHRWQAASDQAIWLQRDPCDWARILAQVPLGSGADVTAAVSRAVAASSDWARQPLAERQAMLRAWGQVLAARQAQLYAALVSDVAKPIADARGEIAYGLSLLGSCLDQAETESPGTTCRIRYRPLGTIGLITPWNNPFAIPVGKIVPALLYGNTVVWKPALQAPRVVNLILETLAEAGLPPDCLTAVHGDGRTAAELLKQPAVNAISFTGSVRVGRQLAALCAREGKRLQAELGGNNAVIVTAHTELPALACALVPAIYSFAGQRCTAPRRLIVTTAARAAFSEALLEALADLRLGRPETEGVQLGPLISRARQLEVQALVAETLAAGGSLLHGGRIPPGFEAGCWFEPTLIADPDPACRAVTEEGFCPLSVLLEAPDFKTALALSNGVAHGLSASLYSDDAHEQAQFLEGAEAGILRINSPQGVFAPDAPFGGWKASGLGVPEHGRWDREFYSRPQAVYGLG